MTTPIGEGEREATGEGEGAASAAFVGVTPEEIVTDVVRVSVRLLRRLPAVTIIGLPAGQVREVAERVRSAFEATGIEFPRCRVEVTVWAPSGVKNLASTGYDLAIAVAILRAMGRMPPGEAETEPVFYGELTLSGDIRPVRGLFAAAHGLAWRTERPIVGSSADPDAGLANEHHAPVRTVPNLAAVIAGDFTTPASVAMQQVPLVGDFADLRPAGDPEGGASRTIEARKIALAVKQGRGVLLTGVKPGCGASMVAKRLQGLLPWTDDRRLEAWANHSAAGLPLADVVPFRAPHHTATAAGIIGSRVGLGEAALAEHGVLYLDNIEEFSHATLEMLGYALRHRPSVQLVASSALSDEELWRKLPTTILEQLPVSVPMRDTFIGQWPDTATMRGWVGGGA